VSIQFSEIHNLVRTYQRVLKLEPVEPVQPVQASSKQADRVSISRQARELVQVTPAAHATGDEQVARS